MFTAWLMVSENRWGHVNPSFIDTSESWSLTFCPSTSTASSQGWHIETNIYPHSGSHLQAILEWPKNLTPVCMVLDCGSQSTWEEPTQAQGEHANSTQKCPDLGIEPRTFLLWGNSATSAPLCRPNISFWSQITGCSGQEIRPAMASKVIIFCGLNTSSKT